MLGWGLRLLERVLALLLVWALLVGLTVWLETALGLGPWGSLLARTLGLLPLLAFGFLWFRSFLRRRPTLGTLSRELEARIPGLRNRLITAVEFRREEALPGGGTLRYFSPMLVNAFFLETRHTARGRSWIRVFARLPLAGLLVGTMLLCVVAAYLPHFTPFEWRSVLNVYFAPFHRNPFFDPARLLVEPGDTQVTVGDDLTVRARLAGREARSIEILFRAGAVAPDRVRMEREDNGAFTHQFRNLRETLRYSVAAGKRKSPEYEIRVVKRIRLTDLSILLAYPAYTGMGLGLGDKEEGSIEAPIGTRCRLSAAFDETADEVRLHLRRDQEGEPAEKTNAMKDTGSGWEADFLLLHSGSYSISATWQGGSPGESPIYALTAVRDASPSVKLLMPEGDVDLSMKDRLPEFVFFRGESPTMALRYSAEDDLGLRETHLVVENAEGKVLERVPLHGFTGQTTSADEIYPWALQEWWGGDDVWIAVEVKDSLAARPDLGREFYSDEEIRRHTVLSDKVRLTWKPGAEVARQDQKRDGSEGQKGQADKGEKGKEGQDQGDQGEGKQPGAGQEGRKPGPGEQALQLARDVAEIRRQQESVNRDAAAQGEGKPGPAEGGRSEGGGTASPTAPEGQAKEPSGAEGGLAGRQRSLAEQTAEVESRVREAAGAYREEARSAEPGTRSGGGVQEPRPGAAGRKPADGARELDRLADRLGRKTVWDGNRLERGIGSQMRENASDIERQNWDGARSGGEKIARELAEVESALDRIAREAAAAEAPAPGKGEPQTPGQEQLAGGGKREGRTPEPAPGEPVQAPGMAEPGDGSPSAPVSSAVSEGGSESSAPRPSSSMDPTRADSAVNPRYSLPADYMTRFGKGQGTEAPVPPGRLDFGKGTAYSLEKIPTRYRDEVNRYYELLESP